MRLTLEEREQLWREYHTKTGRYAESTSTDCEQEPICELRPETQIDQSIDMAALERTLVKQFIIRFAAAIAILYTLSRALS